MKTVSLGHSSLNVSNLCLGTVYFGSQIDQDASFAFMDHFVSLGGNFLDTARVYADWVSPFQRQSSEKCIGRWLKERGYQDRIIVATKGGHPPLFPPGRPTLSARELSRQADDSRRNLGLDVLPLYYLHRDDPALPVSRIMDALFLLQDQGVIRHIGCSNWTAERIRAANAYAGQNGREGFIAVSNQWSLARPVTGAGDTTLVHTDDELLRLHQETQLPLLPFTSMAQGYLSKLAEGRSISASLKAEYGHPANAAIAGRAQQLGEEKHMSIAQIAQCFFYAQPFDVVPVMAFSSPAQMEEAAAATEMSLTPQECSWLLHG